MAFFHYSAWFVIFHVQVTHLHLSLISNWYYQHAICFIVAHQFKYKFKINILKSFPEALLFRHLSAICWNSCCNRPKIVKTVEFEGKSNTQPADRSCLIWFESKMLLILKICYTFIQILYIYCDFNWNHHEFYYWIGFTAARFDIMDDFVFSFIESRAWEN